MDASPALRIEVVTLFADELAGHLGYGVLGRAVKRGLVAVGTEDPRKYARDVHRTVDDRPYGGGPGMVLKVEPLRTALCAAAARLPPGSLRIHLSAQGERFTQALARRLTAAGAFLLLAGRYEGVDQRLLDSEIDLEVSIGDYVVSGGELPALVIIDACARLVPGVLNDAASAVEESFSDGLLDWPHYTRPEELDGMRVPEVLLQGDHAAVRRWRLKQALGRTWERRPELIAARSLSREEQQLLAEYQQERGCGQASRPAQ